jgi:hypothetical protein
MGARARKGRRKVALKSVSSPAAVVPSSTPSVGRGKSASDCCTFKNTYGDNGEGQRCSSAAKRLFHLVAVIPRGLDYASYL